MACRLVGAKPLSETMLGVPPEGTGVGACQNELWINPAVFTISEGNYVMKPAEDVDECPRTYDMMEFAGF